MYKKGDILITSPQCKWAKEDDSHEFWCDCGEQHSVSDARHVQKEGKSGFDSDVNHPCVYLDHSCDNWVIGGIEEVQQMMIDLGEMLKVLSNENTP